MKIIILSRNTDNLFQCIEALKDQCSQVKMEDVVVVDDGFRIDRDVFSGRYRGIKWLDGVNPFNYSRNINLATRTFPNEDYLLLNDDALCVGNVVEALSKHPGIAVAQVRGPCGPPWQREGSTEEPSTFAAFIAVHITADAWNRVGELDESFDGYGCEDFDWCIRAEAHEVPMTVDRSVRVDHDLNTVSSTFRSRQDFVELDKRAKERFMEKWGAKKAPEKTPKKEKSRMSKRSRKKKRPKSGMQIVHDIPKITVATPSQDMCHSVYTASMVHMVARTLTEAPKIEATFLQYGTSILPLSRQVLATMALENGSSHLLFIDSDMSFPNDMLLRMLRYKEDIVGINARSRRPPYRFTARLNGKNLKTTEHSTGLEKVDTIGTGIVWIRTEVFRKMSLPWFDFVWNPETCIFRGEDYSFCDKAKQAGFEIYVDHDLSKDIEHHGSFGFGALIGDEENGGTS